MKAVYQKAKSQIQTLHEVDQELPWLLTLDLMVIVLFLGFGVGVML